MFTISIIALAISYAVNVLSASTPVQNAAAPVVTLSYGKFQGMTSGGLTQFLGMPFARPPVGNLRFAPPEPPIPFKDIRQATSFGNECPQEPVTKPTSPLPANEDCLFLNVVTPSSMPHGKRLPVVFWIFGGAYLPFLGDTSFNSVTSVVNRSMALGEPVVYVSTNYRLNAFGFLGGKEIKAAGLGNPGIRDQRFALEWVQENIAKFGGDPTKVTLWGESGGAVSIGAHMVINNGNQNGLFRGGFLDSGSPSFYSDITAGQSKYDTLVSGTGCTNASDTLACLRTVPASTLLAVVNDAPGLFQLAWTVTIDGEFITRSARDALEEGHYSKIPFVTGDVDDEGTLFSMLTLNITTNQEFLDFIAASFLPNITNADLAAIAQAYPDDITQGSPFDTGTANALTPEYKRLAAFQGDMFFSGPRRFFLRLAAKRQNAWGFLYKRGKIANGPLGAYHGSDVPEFDGTITTDFIGTDALINFVNHLDPNAPKQIKRNISLLENINWPQWITSTTSPPLFTFLDPAPSVAITPDTFREGPINLLVDIAGKLFK
ncbi:sterol esterase [Rickenella mellea]|uniref:Carboxylic ester hydrolase n=1 Tax=Rickenella mellea TaxID=50990 RepID=A0A4Y7PPN1_9AGAM|nr:sterol esterase [Rickenella mellea]